MDKVAARYALVEILDDNFPFYKGCHKKCIHHANQPEEFHELADAILESEWFKSLELPPDDPDTERQAEGSRQVNAMTWRAIHGRWKRDDDSE